MILAIVLTNAATMLVLAGFAQDFARLRLTPRLTHSDDAADTHPLVSVLIPARNEERNIARCLDGALAQNYGPYEVIVVDDNSTDGTPAILAEYAARNNHMRVVHGLPLPPGWTGKCHACRQAANKARGEWLLFLDADTVPQPTLITALQGHTQQHNLDLTSIFPFLELGSFWERVIIPPFLALISAVFPFERLSDPHARPDEVLANGQCIFVRRAAYESIGGHGAVRNEVLEDVRLAQTLRAAGYRIGGAEGIQHLRVRMYTNGSEVVEGLTKNAAAGYRSAGSRSKWGMARLMALALIPFWLLLSGLVLLIMRGDALAWAVLLHGMFVTAIAFSFWGLLLRRLHRLPWAYALLWPFGLLCYVYIAARSLWQVQSGRGVVWKGRTYAGK